MKAPRYRDHFWYAGSKVQRFVVYGKRYALSGHGAEVRRFLRAVDGFLERVERRADLFTLRSEFRKILARPAIPGLIWCIGWESGWTLLIAIWLLGKVRNRQTISVLDECIAHPDVRVRRHTAKALLRMGAWSQLHDMGERDPDPVVRRWAAYAERPPQDFRTRLSRFVGHEAGLAATAAQPAPSSAEVFLAVTPGAGLPPRRPWFLRRILERIRRLVRGDVATATDVAKPKGSH
jgi:hypothetical protein